MTNIKIVKWGASWCNPCRNFDADAEQIRVGLPNATLEIKEVDDEANKQEMQALGITGIPATFVYQDGKQIGRIQGYPGANKFIETVTAIIEEENNV